MEEHRDVQDAPPEDVDHRADVRLRRRLGRAHQGQQGKPPGRRRWAFRVVARRPAVIRALHQLRQPRAPAGEVGH